MKVEKYDENTQLTESKILGVFNSTDDYDRAISHFTEVLRLDPENNDVVKVLCRLLERPA